MLVLIALVLGAADGGAPVGVSLSPSEVYARISASVFLVTTDAALGSGVIVGPELLVTNLHVIKGAKTIRVSRDDSGWDATVEKSNIEHDLALIRVPGLQGSAPRRRALSTMRVGERVYALGAPQGLEQTFSEGIVSALRPGTKEFRPLQHTAPMAQGSSGGGLFDDRGRLVGINTLMRAVVMRGRVDLAGDLNFAVPADWIDELLSAKGQPLVASGDGGTSRPLYTALRRPLAVDCHLVRRDRYAPGLSGELTERIGEEQLDDHLYVVGFREEVAAVRARDPFIGERRDVVMSAIDIASGVVQFTRASGQVMTFAFGEDGSIVVLFAEAAELHGQRRGLVTFGECSPVDFEAIKEEREAVIRRQEVEFEGRPAGQASTEEACEKGAPGACLVAAKEKLRSGAEKKAAAYFGKACTLGSRRGCEVAVGMYTQVGNSMVATTLRQRLCQLGGCSPSDQPAQR